MATRDAEPYTTPARGQLRRLGDERGVAGNEQLTAVTGALLVVMLAVIGVTILRIHQLISLHLFVGMMLLGPVALKLASTGYRFASYYGGRRTYRRKGPPAMPVRILAGPVLLTTVLVFASGVVLLVGGPSTRSTWFPVHKLGFVAWLMFMGLHVLWHLPGASHAVRVELGPDGSVVSRVRGRSARLLLIASAVALGVVL